MPYQVSLPRAPLAASGRAPLATATASSSAGTEAHPNTCRAHDETKRKLASTEQRLTNAKRDLRNAQRREKRAHKKLAKHEAAEAGRAANQEAEELRVGLLVESAREEERAHTADVVEAIREQERTRTEGLVKTAREEEQMLAHIRIAAAREEERSRANTKIEQVQATERARADVLLHAVHTEYTRRIACLEAHADSLLARIATLEEEAEELELETEEEISQLRLWFTGALDAAEAYLDDARSTIASLTSTHENHLHDVQDQLAKALQDAQTLRTRVHSLQKEKITLQRRVARFPGQQARAIERALGASTQARTDAPLVFKLKENGVVPERVRMLVRDLAGLGVKVKQVRMVIPLVARAAGLEVEGDLSERTGGRAVNEGGYMAQMQVVDELQAADGQHNCDRSVNVANRHLGQVRPLAVTAQRTATSRKSPVTSS